MALFGFLDAWRKTRSGLDALARVARIEIDVLRTYDHAIRRIGHPGTADQLAQFRNEHAKHLDDLFSARRLARRFPERIREEAHGRHPGFEGSIAAASDSEGALREVRAIEEVVSRAWLGLSGTVPKGMGAIIERFREDERRHARFLDKLIETRVWELEETVPETP